MFLWFARAPMMRAWLWLFVFSEWNYEFKLMLLMIAHLWAYINVYWHGLAQRGNNKRD
jgi:hypothetical protein